MKKYFVYLLLVVVFLAGCEDSQTIAVNSLDILGELEAQNDRAEEEKNILIIVGEGGVSGKMFIRSAATYQAENGGVVYDVANGDQFVWAMNDFLENYGEIDHLQYFGHGNHVGLYVNQEPNVNGGIYVNDPDLNEGYVAASAYEVPRDAFAEYGWIKFNGCNVADGYPEADTLAQRMANYFDVDVVAPMGPTEFSRVPYAVDPIENSNFLSPDFDGDVYMVPTYEDQGFVVVKPQEVADTGYVDVRVGQSFTEAGEGLLKRGLIVSQEEEYLPYKNVNYVELVHFCRVVFGEGANCRVDGYVDEDIVRNLHALKMLVDAYGAELSYTSPWYNSYIWWANQNDLLTEGFVNKMWYTRGEMAELSWNFVTNL